MTELVNVRVETKPPRGRYEDKDVHAKSGEVKTYNLFDQTEEALEANGLTSLYRRVKRKERKPCSGERAKSKK